MFWKIANKYLSFSIAHKIMLFNTLITMTIMVSSSLFLFPTFEKITHNNTVFHHHLLSECYISLSLAILFSLIFTILFSKLLARHSTQQIHRLTQQVNNIHIHSLAHQINIEPLPNELKLLGESFNIMLMRIQNSMDQLTQFSSDIAHELRNPIHNLLVMNEIALTKQYSTEKSREIFESNLEECRYLLSLIENLWFIAGSDHGHVSIQPTSFEAKREITKLIDYFESYASVNEIEIICEGDAKINADVILFKRAMSNLLSNSLKYTQKQGKISIRIDESKSHAVITVSDTGIGIDEKHLPKLFNRFYRVDPSRSQETGGLGLGLAIVKSIMNLHHGQIEIQSQVNVGTSVLLYFPIK